MYKIETVSTIETQESIPFEVGSKITYRRYSEFEKLLQFLREQPELKGCLIPELPAKDYLSSAAPELVAEREKNLQHFL